MLPCAADRLIFRQTLVRASIILKMRAVIRCDLVLTIVTTADEHKAIANGQMLRRSDLSNV